MARTAIILFSSLLLLAACSAPPNWLSVDISPAPGTEGVDVATTVRATFADSLENLEADDFRLMHGDQPVDVTLDLSDDGTTATLHINGDGRLAEMTEYTVLLREGISSVNGYTLASTLEASFKTGKADPASNADGGDTTGGGSGSGDGDGTDDGDTDGDGEDGGTGDGDGAGDGDAGDGSGEGDGDAGDPGDGDGDGDGTGEGDDADDGSDDGEPAAPSVTSVRPADEATDVSVSAIVEVEFDMAMALASFDEPDAIVVSTAAGDVAGEIDYQEGVDGDFIATFAPDHHLDFDTWYTVTVSAAVENADGVALGSEKVSQFKTAGDDVTYIDERPRTIDGRVVRVTFSEPLGYEDGTVIEHGGAFKVVPNDLKGEAIYTVENEGEDEVYVLTYTFEAVPTRGWYTVKMDGDLQAADETYLPVEEWRVYAE